MRLAEVLFEHGDAARAVGLLEELGEGGQMEQVLVAAVAVGRRDCEQPPNTGRSERPNRAALLGSVCRRTDVPVPDGLLAQAGGFDLAEDECRVTVGDDRRSRV